jgi:hypothetical protein
MDGREFFSLFAEIMHAGNMPSPTDPDMTRVLNDMGIIPGQKLDWDDLSFKKQTALQAAVTSGKLGLKLAYDSLVVSKLPVNNWHFPPNDTGNYTTDYLTRAGIVQEGIGANVREDAIYAIAVHDDYGIPFDGFSNYTITFTEEVPV